MHDKVQALKGDYVASLQPDLELLEALESELAFGLEEERTFEELRAMAHRLAGSAGSFGFGSMGDVARAIDQALVKGERDAKRLVPLVHQWRDSLTGILGQSYHRRPGVN